jgi:hypothetical protein
MFSEYMLSSLTQCFNVKNDKLNVKMSSHPMEIDSEVTQDGYNAESESESSDEDINYHDYDKDTNWDNWDLEPNVKLRKRTKSRPFKKFCILRVHQPVCKKVKKKVGVNLTKLLSELALKD